MPGPTTAGWATSCNGAPGRRAGVGLITVEDIDVAVAEIQQMRDIGLFGGALLCGGTGDNPLYNRPRYEPVWAACADEVARLVGATLRTSTVSTSMPSPRSPEI